MLQKKAACLEGRIVALLTSRRLGLEVGAKGMVRIVRCIHCNGVTAAVKYSLL